MADKSTRVQASTQAQAKKSLLELEFSGSLYVLLLALPGHLRVHKPMYRHKKVMGDKSTQVHVSTQAQAKKSLLVLALSGRLCVS